MPTTLQQQSLNNLHLTVAAVIEDNGRFLVVEEYAGGELVINQPAGHVEPNESLLQAVIRETKEETAWTFTPTAFLGVYLWQHPVSGEHFLRAVFSGTHSNHAPDQPLDDGIEQAVWLSRDELLARSPALRSPMVLMAIDAYASGELQAVTAADGLSIDELLHQAVSVEN